MRIGPSDGEDGGAALLFIDDEQHSAALLFTDVEGAWTRAGYGEAGRRTSVDKIARNPVSTQLKCLLGRAKSIDLSPGFRKSYGS